MSKTKKIILTVALAILVGLGIYFLTKLFSSISYQNETLKFLIDMSSENEIIQSTRNAITILYLEVTFVFISLLIDLFLIFNLWFNFYNIFCISKINLQEYREKRETRKQQKIERKINKLNNKISK